jgi:hypothetical protein
MNFIEKKHAEEIELRKEAIYKRFRELDRTEANEAELQSLMEELIDLEMNRDYYLEHGLEPDITAEDVLEWQGYYNK